MGSLQASRRPVTACPTFLHIAPAIYFSAVPQTRLTSRHRRTSTNTSSTSLTYPALRGQYIWRLRLLGISPQHSEKKRAMGTLTGDCPRLDAHCPHKLATSCRLTSTSNCCACADERVHSRTYRVYIDGIGFVQRGTRWQGYCWFCKGMFASNCHLLLQALHAHADNHDRVLDKSTRRHRAAS